LLEPPEPLPLELLELLEPLPLELLEPLPLELLESVA
jgi:hypothetical protein